MRNYLELCNEVLLKGEQRMDRTGTGTLSLFGRQLRFDLQEGFPAVTTKKLYVEGVWHELLWFLKGHTNIQYLKENNIHIWDEWAKENGFVGPIYGHQWRFWTNTQQPFIHPDGTITYNTIDQLQSVIDTIKVNPTDRRMLVSAWNVAELPLMALPPCHYAFQFYVRRGTYLDCKVDQRSADLFLGVPFDIASYATLVHMVAHITGLRPGELIFNFGDTHIYLNHLSQITTQIGRKPHTLPLLDVNVHDREIKSIDDFRFDDLKLVGYTHHPAIKGKVSV